MPKHTEYDNELAEFTDQLLAGKEPDMAIEEAELVTVVRQLQRTITDEPAPSSLKIQLAQRLDMEWDLHHQRQTRWWETPRVRRIAMLLAASIALVIGAAVVLSTADNGNSTGFEGAANGPVVSVAIVALFIIGVIGLIVFFRRDR